MASHTFCSGPLPGTQLRSVQTGGRQRRLKETMTVAGVSKKVNTYDDKWSKVRHLHLTPFTGFQDVPGSPKTPPAFRPPCQSMSMAPAQSPLVRTACLLPETSL